jgi:plastocyanin
MLRLLLVALALMTAPTALAGGGHDDEGPASEAAPADDHAEGLRSPDLQPGESWSHTFTEAGKFDYHCHPHPWMIAAIDVLPDSDGISRNVTIEFVEPAGQDFEAWTLSPKVMSLEVGDNVTWVNRGSVVHVVQQTVGEHIEHVGVAGGEDAGDGHTHSEAASHVHMGAAWAWILGAAGAGGLLVWVLRRSDPTRTRPAAADRPADLPPAPATAGPAPEPKEPSASR